MKKVMILKMLVLASTQALLSMEPHNETNPLLDNAGTLEAASKEVKEIQLIMPNSPTNELGNHQDALRTSTYHPLNPHVKQPEESQKILEQILPDLTIKEKTMSDTLEGWKKWFKGEPQYNEVIKRIIIGPKAEDLTNPITCEQNLNRLLRQLVEKNELKILYCVLDQLYNQRNLWQPGFHARDHVKKHIGHIRTLFQKEQQQKSEYLIALQAQLEKRKKDFERNKASGEMYLQAMEEIIEKIPNKESSLHTNLENACPFESVIQHFDTFKPI